MTTLCKPVPLSHCRELGHYAMGHVCPVVIAHTHVQAAMPIVGHSSLMVAKIEMNASVIHVKIMDAVLIPPVVHPSLMQGFVN